ncbi:MAG: DegT/DnrJ/EryC1/StrS family aminotransferase [Acidobacteriota bacterium]
MAVPFIDLKRFEPGFLDRWADICRDTSANTRFVGGPEVQRLEQRLAELTGATEVVGCANGTDALQLALRAIGVGEGDVVVIPDATFWATFEAVINVGAKPVTVDIDEGDLQLDVDAFRESIKTYRPKAAILVHLYGWGSAKLQELRSIAAEAGVLLVEDGAQVLGAEVDGVSPYRDATIATVSFYPAKVLGACGDAGAVFCSTAEQAQVVRQLGNHGRTSHYFHGLVGWNSRMGGLEAGYLNLGLDVLEARLDSRREVAERYRRELADSGLRLIAPPDNWRENGYLSVALIDPERRDDFQAVLREHGIGFGNVYPSSIATQPGAEPWLVGQVGGEIADRVSRGVVNLPLFASMREEEVAEVISVAGEAAKVL